MKRKLSRYHGGKDTTVTYYPSHSLVQTSFKMHVLADVFRSIFRTTERRENVLVFTPIHRALGLPPGELSIDLLQRAIEAGVPETTSLDWKRCFYSQENKKWQEEAAKDIAAMANSGGGWLVFGVEENGNNNAASKLHALEWKASSEQQIRTVAYAKVGPPVLGIELYPIEYQDGYIVFMRIPDSSDAPHFARKGDESFIAPYRNGAHTVFMSDREIERGFRERFQRFDDREALLNRQFQKAELAISSEEGVCLAIAAVPFEPSSIKPLTESEAREFTQPKEDKDFIHRGFESIPIKTGELRKGMRQWIVRTRPSSVPHEYKKFLYDDGTLLACHRVGNLIQTEQGARTYPVGERNHCRSVEIELVLTDFFATLREHAKARQSFGMYQVRAGLIGSLSEPIIIRTLTDSCGMTELEDSLNCEPIAVPERVTIECSPLSPTRDPLEVLRSVALDIVNQGGIQSLQLIKSKGELG